MRHLRNFALKNIILVLGDIAISIISVYASFYIRLNYMDNFDTAQYMPFLPRAVTFSAFIVLMCNLMDLYAPEKRMRKREILIKILFSGFFAFISLAAFYYLVPQVTLGRGILLIAIVISFWMQLFWHIGYELRLKIPGVAKNVLILGTGPAAKTMGGLFSINGNGNGNALTLTGYVNCLNESVVVPSEYVIGNGDSILDIALREKADTIVVSLTERRGTFPVHDVLNCKLNGIEVIDGPSFYEQMTGKLLVENLNPSWFIFSDGFVVTEFIRRVKRVCDLVLAVIGLVISSPFLLIIPALVKLDSPGPILLRQKRVGAGEKEFVLYKFRTMVEDAEKETGPVWSQVGDNRVTRIGRLLRKTRLDEIPQLLNVLKGDMSFVGPRPERPFFVGTLKKQIPYYSERHCIKPGITGWAQVRYPYGASENDALEKLRYDLYYIKHLSPFLDLLIVLETVKIIIFGRGGR